MPSPGTAPVAFCKGAAADLGKIYLERVQKVNKYNDIKSKVNIIPKLHHDITIMTCLVSNVSIFTVSDV
jgi:hypothetical protein